MAAAAARPVTSSTKADAPATSGDCSSDVQDLMANCQDYVMFPADPKIDPSQACCAAVQRANMPCVCNKVTPEVEQLICMDKVVYVVAFCKKPFQPGSNCGKIEKIVCMEKVVYVADYCKKPLQPGSKCGND
uniref:Bifunctional inhibitor/plant lipid transfer protein/seed storage helical domain-containing protein n=1 Tax=Oryza punctata TaxID=4537 RepID=A0A0E0JPV2_ORYPU